MDSLLLLAVAWVIAFVINMVPAFMPPTWSVLAVFHVTSDVPLLPLTIGGAAFSALGRMLLALGSRRLERFMPESDRRNAQALGNFVTRHRAWRNAIVFLYCLAPLPSNPIFIAAGIGRVPLIPVTVAFLLSRMIADTFWVWTAGAVSSSAGELFVNQLKSWQSIAIQVAAVVVVVMLFRLPWARWLGLDAGDSDDGRSAAADRDGVQRSVRRADA